MDVLILNNSYEPLQIVSLRKAMKLIFKKRVELIKVVEDKYYYTFTEKFPIPSVIKLNQYIAPKNRIVPYSRKNVLIRDKYICQYCGQKNADTIEHIIPISKGGTNEWTNVVACCKKCNVFKGDKILSSTNLKLLSVPRELTFISYLKNKNVAKEEWLEFFYYK